MVKKLFLLDGMALVYRAHFAFISRPILTSKGVNTSALYGFTQTLLDILKNQQPTHLGVAFDTEAPTQRHVEFADYKAHREEMPEDLSAALPHVRRMVEAFNIPVLICDGYEADDIIGTLVRRAERKAFSPTWSRPTRISASSSPRTPSSTSPRGAARGWRSSACRRFRAAGVCSGPSRWWMCWR